MHIFTKVSRLCVLIVVAVVLNSSQTVFGLTSKYDKWVKVLKSPSIVREAPERATPFSLIDAPKEIDYWKGIIPFEDDKDEDQYVVIPTLWIAAPIMYVPEWSDDYTLMTRGREIDINYYLNHGVMHYPWTWTPGDEGNVVLFGHSNFFKSWPWNYKAIFADLMNLDVWYESEIWVYIREQDDPTEYELRKFRITESYETVPTDVWILQPRTGKELTVFACTDGLNWRWIIRSELIELDETLVPYTLSFPFRAMEARLDALPEDMQEEIEASIDARITELRRWTATSTYSGKFFHYLLNYIEREVE